MLLSELGGICLLALSAAQMWNEQGAKTFRIVHLLPGLAALWLFLNLGIFLYTTRAGKFSLWAELLDRPELKGD